MRRLWIAFDFDGVIVDSMPVQAEAWVKAAAECSQDPGPLVDNLYRGHAGARMFEGLGLSDTRIECLRRTKDRLWHQKRSSVPLFPGAGAAIEGIAGFSRLGIASTASSEYIMSILSREGLTAYFDPIVTDADAPAPKPDRSLLEMVAAQFGCSVNELWMVGDTEADLRLSQNAGSRFLLFAPDGKQRSGIENGAVPSVGTWDEVADFFGNLVGHE